MDILKNAISIIWLIFWLKVSVDYAWKRMEETKYPTTTIGVIMETFPPAMLSLGLIIIGCLPVLFLIF